MMRIIDAYFRGYIGFYNGMGLHELHIDLTKCKHNIVLIVGKNGSGKSTLEGALNIFPDNNSCFRPNVEGEKRLKIVSDNDLYEIDIIYPVDSNGNRKVNKAFIAKNGIELNPNGNVTSYKDLLSTEFDLDPNFVALSMLTSVDRGLGDKRPAERKKFVGSVIDNLNIYNEIYKTLNKKSLVYKSHINTIHTKIQSAGDRVALQTTLDQLHLQENNLENGILENNNKIVELQAKNSMDDEDLRNINTLNSQKSNIESKISSIESSLGLYYNKTKIEKEEIEESLEKGKALLEELRKKLDTSKNTLREKSDRLSQVSSNIHELEVTISEANSEIDNTLEKRYSDSCLNIDSLSRELDTMGFTSDTSKIPEYNDVLDFTRKFIEKLDVFYDGLTVDQVQSITIDYNPNYLNNLQQKSQELLDILDNAKNMMLKATEDLKTLSILDNRPKKCKINDCPFIKDAVIVSKSSTKDSLADSMESIQKTITTYTKYLNDNQENIAIYNSLIPKRLSYQSIITLFENISSKYRDNPYLLNNFSDIENKIGNLSPFNDVRNPEWLVDGLNILVQLEAELKTNSILKASYESHRDKIKLINSTRSTLDNMKREQDELNLSIVEIREEITKVNGTVEAQESLVAVRELYNESYTQYKEYHKVLDDILYKLSEYEKKSSQAMSSLNEIQQYKNNIEKYREDLRPVKNSISDITGRLALLDTYYNEFNMYNDSYRMVETLKKYCSPTGGGIQTIFMQLYMSKTLELSNQILGMLFGGEYHLVDFVINDSEFRIPFIGNGLLVDDISSGSNSQICMMGMVINLVLLYQASTKYNIAYLDEIDAGLDHRNRFDFVNALYRCIPLLNIEQLFMISHSMETDTSAVDIIKLKGYDDFEDTVNIGNIIFDVTNM